MNFKGQEAFLSKIEDQIYSSRVRNKPFLTFFLTPVEVRILNQILPKDMFVSYYGGYAQAQRKVAFISPFEMTPAFDVDILSATYDPRYKSLTHRDVLGALMHLGIERNRIGDLIVDQNRIYIICKRNLSEFIQSNLFQIGRCHVSFSLDKDAQIHYTGYEMINISVASLRVDAIVSALKHCSRSQSAAMINQGLIKVNDVVLEQNCQLCNNDFVSIRGVGRFQFDEVSHTTKKGRLVLQFKKFI